MKKVNLEIIKPWITKKITDLLGFEDEVLIGYVFGLLEEKVLNRTRTYNSIIFIFISLYLYMSIWLDSFC